MLDNLILKCQFCGTEGTKDDFDMDFINHNGFWCPNCDGHTFINSVDNDKRKFTLILEDKSNKKNISYKTSVKLNKRLSPLRYPGGKSKLIGYLYSKLQRNKSGIFIEPFSGGASVGLALLEAKIIKHLILNDIDYGIYSLFYIDVNDPCELIRKIQNTTPTYIDFYTAQSIVKGKYKNCNMLCAAWSLLLVNRLSFSGIYYAGHLGGKSGNNTSQLLSRWNPTNLVNQICKIHNMKSNITVFNDDALELIERMYYSENTTIFIDPPYFEIGRNYIIIISLMIHILL